MLPIIYLDLIKNQSNPSKETAPSVQQKFLRSVIRGNTSLVVRILDPKGKPEAIKHLATTCTQWLQEHGVHHHLQADDSGLWLHLANSLNDP